MLRFAGIPISSLDEANTFRYGTLLFLAWMSIRKWEPLLNMHKLKFKEAASKFLFILIFGDVFYFLLHVGYLNGFLDSRFNLEKIGLSLSLANT